MDTISDKSTMKEIREYLKAKRCKTSFKNKTEALAFIRNLTWTDTFPWNDDQKVVLGWEKDHKYKEHVVQGTFGSGKSTMMLGIYLKQLNQAILSPKDILVCAFNISIKNELKKKIRELGFKDKPQVRTFDSMIYEVCAHYQMTGLDKPDYEGRRTFVEKKMREEEDEKKRFRSYDHIRLVMVDEVQDLDQKALEFFSTFFPNARFYFFGDVFQCIQKEPRCSLLWRLLKPKEGRIIHFMKKTPRVPTPILDEIKNALTHHYPEFKKPISDWYSSNPLQNTKITWIPIKHYSQIFEECRQFLSAYDPGECMVLTFSSAITVKGNMGDLSRFRQYFLKEGIPVNRNYKTMESGKLFLSTVNSSKGLERKHVFIALTFPLEMAFANFSSNLVVNLVSVGLSRCKEDVRFCVPVYEDRFSEVLRLYPQCPTPDKEAGSSVRRLKSEATQEKTVSAYLNRSHSATEILRQNILSFETRNHLRSHAKMMPPSVVFPPGNKITWKTRGEEEASFMGILFEVLITSQWSNKWPPLDTAFITDVATNPMFAHCRGGIHKQFQSLARRFRIPFEATRDKFSVLYEYTEHHILLTQKIRVRISQERKEEMRRVWLSMERDVRSMKPTGNLKAQVNLSRPFMTGVADLICESENEHIVYEIKTCTGSDWKENAFVQAALYCAMSKKLKSTIRLFNPFRREIFEYKISLTPTEKNDTLQKVDADLLLWNLNCFLAKYDHPFHGSPTVDVGSLVCWSGKTGIEWLAPTKTRIGVYTREEYEKQEKTNVSFCPNDFTKFNPVSENNKVFLDWILDETGYVREEKDTLDFENDFVRAVLLCCYFRMHCF